MQYPQISSEIITKFFKLTDEAKSILITSHRNPDDDSVGSTLSLYVCLKEKYPNKKIIMGYTGELNNRWNYFKNFDKIRSGEDIVSYAENFDLIIFLDGGQWHRFSEEAEKLSLLKVKTFCIDHHSSVPDSFTASVILPTAASTSELVFLLLCKDKKNIPQPLAETILLGIIGDTGSFQFLKPQQSYVFTIAQRLITEGNIEIQEMVSKYSNYSYSVFLILKELVRSTKVYEIDGWPKFTLSSINREFIDDNNYSYLDTQEAIAIFRGTFSNSIEGVPWSIALYPKENGDVSVSLRSLPKSVNVRILVEQMDIGGGHDRAAGALFEGNGKRLNSPDCIEKMLHWLRTNKPVLS